MVIVSFLSVIQGIAIIFQASLLARAITMMFEGAAASAALPSFLLFLLFFVARHFLQWGMDRLSYAFAEKTSLDMQRRLIEKLFSSDGEMAKRNSSGSIVTLILEGISKFRTYIELFIPRAIAVFVIPLSILIYVFTLDLLSGIVLILTMPILIAFLILLGLVAKRKINAQMGTYKMLAGHFVDSLRGLVTLKYLGKSTSHKKAIETVSDRHRKATLRTLRVAFLSSFSLDFFSSLSVAVVAVELGLRLIEGNIGLEPALAILILAPEYFLPVRTLGNDYHATMEGKATGKQMAKILEKEGVSSGTKSPVVPRWSEKSALTVQGLEKRAEGEDRYILHNIDFTVQGLQKVGIVGKSGAGKTTLIDVLAGLRQPTGGTFKLNGSTLPSFACESWRRQITYIPQHPYIFSGTMAENIAWYAPNASRKEIEEAADVAGLTKLISTLPKGLDEKIGQGGRSLSGGEEQRIALARSVLQERPIMIFDEPTAHLDIETEFELKKMILPILENKLVFFATHRLHWMKEMDVIIVLDHGRIVETGSHNELYKKKGAYYRLIQAQKGGTNGGAV